MGGDNIGKFDTGASERLNWMVYMTSFTMGSMKSSGACGGSRFMGAEIGVNIELIKNGGFAESDGWGMVWCWVDGSKERMLKPSHGPCCKTCPVHNPFNWFTRLLYQPLLSYHHPCLLQILQPNLDTECDDFYIGEMCCSLSNCIIDTVLSPQPRTQISLLQFTLISTRLPFRIAGLSMSYTIF